MALTEINYPVTGEVGTYKNTFPSQKPLYANFNRKDGLINSISSGTNSKVRIEFTSAFGSINIGQFVIFQSDGYLLQSSKVLAIVNATTIDVDTDFTSANAANGFVNYNRNYYLEIRYVAAGSGSGDQNATEILEDFSQVTNAKNGDIKANISSPGQLITPDFEIENGVAANLFQSYKIQFRESYEGNRSGVWISPTVDVSIMLVHASKDFVVDSFTDANTIKRFIKGFPLVYSLIYSAINDSGSNELRVVLSQYDISQTLISNDDVGIIVNMNGVYILSVDTDSLDVDTAFIKFAYVLSSSNAQYDPTQYDPSQYA